MWCLKHASNLSSQARPRKTCCDGGACGLADVVRKSTRLAHTVVDCPAKFIVVNPKFIVFAIRFLILNTKLLVFNTKIHHFTHTRRRTYSGRCRWLERRMRPQHPSPSPESTSNLSEISLETVLWWWLLVYLHTRASCWRFRRRRSGYHARSPVLNHTTISRTHPRKLLVWWGLLFGHAHEPHRIHHFKYKIHHVQYKNHHFEWEIAPGRWSRSGRQCTGFPARPLCPLVINSSLC